MMQQSTAYMQAVQLWQLILMATYMDIMTSVKKP
jgi:hypothetical protein